MTGKPMIRLSVVLPITILSLTMLVSMPTVVSAGTLAARIDSFTSPEGDNYFALSLKPEGVAPDSRPRDVLVMFNTSAAQTGDFRAKALETLQDLLAALPSGDRVQLLAVDLNAISLTDSFVDPKSPQMADALTALKSRVPLGATDMTKGLTAAAGSFAADSKNPRTVIYIGDGRSAAKFITSEESSKLIGKLADGRISFNSYLIGAKPDIQILGVLAGQTGGVVVEDQPETTAQQASAALNSAAHASVLWPQSAAWPAEMTEVFPQRTPPLRTDRDTVLIGLLKGQGPLDLQYAAETPGGPEKLTSSVKPGVSDDANSYLRQWVEYARRDGGATLPLVDSTSLEKLRVAANVGSMSLKELAGQALAAGNLDNAEKLIGEAVRQDPHDPETLALKRALEKNREGGPASDGAPLAAEQPLAGDAEDLNLVGPAINDKEAGVMAQRFQQEHKIISQVIQAEVHNAINQARSQMSADPQGATQNLMLTLEKVRQVAELAPDVRDQLSEQLQTALREAARRKVEIDNRRQQQQESLAAARERMLLADNLLHDQQKVKQLMERFNSLMNEGKYRLAEEAAAAEAVKIAPQAPETKQAELFARTTGYYTDQMALKQQRLKAVVDTLFQVDKSDMPLPDDMPIIYSDPQTWQELTIRRKEKWGGTADLARRGPAEKKIMDALKAPTELNFVETPLQQVIDYLKDYHKIEIQLDNRVLSDVGITPESPITRSLKGVSLRSAMRLMLRDLGLTYMIENEVLLITTPEEAESRLTTVVYPVADLVITPQMMNNSVQMGGGMMGGMMGGMGGGMGGMGGMGGGMGGMGGMGGGMGGMGGMGGGMGMFNVPRELLPNNHPLNLMRDKLKNIPAGGFQAFSVKDDLSTPLKNQQPASAESTPKTSTPPSAATKVEKIQIEIAPGDNPEQVWDKYFTAHSPSPAALRDEVRRLMNEKQFEQVIALINAALRQHQAQPWMYEALSLAMQAAGRPREEIERAIMSAVDFCDNSADLLYIGVYLARLGLNQRALEIFRQVASQDPLRPEPYMLGLNAARQLNDRDGLRWTSLGILNQAWTKDQAHIWQTGVGVAKEILEKLKAEKQNKQADEFLAELDQAVVRDCVAIVHWTGDADVDLSVEEPSGAICSLRNPRTTAGGVMLGDMLAQTESDNSGGHSQVYVCPQGFDGTYRLLLWRVWGKVTSGKVTVEVTTHFRDKKSAQITQKIPLDNDQAVVVFQLKEGRRKQSLQQQQVANAVGGQMALNQQILAQQIASELDSSSLSSLYGDRSAGPAGAKVRGLAPLGVPDVVGYQPVIITLPKGTSLQATAVISHDRRYVRVRCSPMFSAVTSVYTFDFISGATSASSAGTGSSGFSGGGGNTGLGGSSGGAF